MFNVGLGTLEKRMFVIMLKTLLVYFYYNTIALSIIIV